MLSNKLLVSIPKAIRTIRRISAGSLQRDLTFQQLRILTLIDEGMSQTQMAQSLQVSMAAISKIVETLVNKKFLIRETGEDRRCLKLKLTPKGRKFHLAVKQSVSKELDIHLKKLTPKELSDLKRGLDVLDKLIGSLNEN